VRQTNKDKAIKNPTQNKFLIHDTFIEYKFRLVGDILKEKNTWMTQA